MIRANEAKVEWNESRKLWQVVIQVGAEVIRRPCPKKQHEAPDSELREIAMQTARDEGYEVDVAQVHISR